MPEEFKDNTELTDKNNSTPEQDSPGVKDTTEETTVKDNTDGIKDNTKEVKRKEQEAKTNREVQRVISGHNDIFKKDYKFDELEVEFTIKLKFPSLVDQARVRAHMEELFGGYASLIHPNSPSYKAYYMLATIQHQMNKYKSDSNDIYIPKMFRNMEEIYNPFILARIYDDFAEWMNRFHY